VATPPPESIAMWWFLETKVMEAIAKCGLLMAKVTDESI
jgi:hypothetical protein